MIWSISIRPSDWLRPENFQSEAGEHTLRHPSVGSVDGSVRGHPSVGSVDGSAEKAHQVVVLGCRHRIGLAKGLVREDQTTEQNSAPLPSRRMPLWLGSREVQARA